jgi:hypothetical protein
MIEDDRLLNEKNVCELCTGKPVRTVGRHTVYSLIGRILEIIVARSFVNFGGFVWQRSVDLVTNSYLRQQQKFEQIQLITLENRLYFLSLK